MTSPLSRTKRQFRDFYKARKWLSPYDGEGFFVVYMEVQEPFFGQLNFRSLSYLVP